MPRNRREVVALLVALVLAVPALAAVDSRGDGAVQLVSASYLATEDSAVASLRCNGPCPEIVIAELWHTIPEESGGESVQLEDPDAVSGCRIGWTGNIALWHPSGLSSTTLEVPSMNPRCLVELPAVLVIRWGGPSITGNPSFIPGAKAETGVAWCWFGGHPTDPNEDQCP